MHQYQNELSELKKSISITTYRAYAIFSLLLKAPHTKDEIISYFETDKIINKRISLDTLNFDLNTLKTIGCKIAKPILNKNKYKLENHPFKCEFTDKEMSLLNYIRDKIFLLNNTSLILKTNQLYSSLNKITKTNAFDEKLNKSDYLKKYNKSILRDISECCEKQYIVKFVYQSPIYGKEWIKAKAYKIFYRNKRFYFFGYSYKHQKMSTFRIDKMNYLMIEDISDDIIFPKENNFATIKLTGDAKNSYIKEFGEEIIEETNEYIKVKVSMENKFFLIQRIATFAHECEVLGPQEFTDTYLNHITSLLGENIDEN